MFRTLTMIYGYTHDGLLVIRPAQTIHFDKVVSRWSGNRPNAKTILTNEATKTRIFLSFKESPIEPLGGRLDCSVH